MSDDFYYLNGTQIKGVYKSSSPDILCVDKDVLDELVRDSKRCKELEKREGERINAIRSGQESRGISSTADYAKYFSAKSAEVRKARKRLSDAIIVAHSILGYDTFAIKKVLEEKGLHSSPAKISRAISVSRPEDKERLEALMIDYPDIFANVSSYLFEKWYSERVKKAERKSVQKSSEWGE